MSRSVTNTKAFSGEKKKSWKKPFDIYQPKTRKMDAWYLEGFINNYIKLNLICLHSIRGNVSIML